MHLCGTRKTPGVAAQLHLIPSKLTGLLAWADLQSTIRRISSDTQKSSFFLRQLSSCRAICDDPRDAAAGPGPGDIHGCNFTAGTDNTSLKGCEQQPPAGAALRRADRGLDGCHRLGRPGAAEEFRDADICRRRPRQRGVPLCREARHRAEEYQFAAAAEDLAEWRQCQGAGAVRPPHRRPHRAAHRCQDSRTGARWLSWNTTSCCCSARATRRSSRLPS